MVHAELQIKGMSCNHCVIAVREELLKLKGLILDDIKAGSASVDYDETLVSPEQIKAAVAEAGYEVASLQPAP